MGTNILEIHGLWKKYPSFELKDVSFSLPEGSIMGFIGRNGAGKTTTLKAVVNLIHKDAGKVTMFDQDFFTHESECKSQLGFFLAGIDYFQRTKLKKLTDVTKRFYPSFDDSKYQRYLQEFGLDETKSFKQLSNGMKIKYQLAVSLSHGAKLFVFDEPTSGLDPVSRDEIQEVFKKIVSDHRHSILFSTHITSDLDKCADFITYISNGTIIASKSKPDFIADFLLVKGPENKVDEADKRSCVSYRIRNGVFEGLMGAKLETRNAALKYEAPNLEDIMVFYERSLRHEEFTL